MKSLREYIVLVENAENTETTGDVTATVVKKVMDWSQSPMRETSDTFEINASTEEELFAKFFREYDNRYKYVNSTNFRLADDELRARYVEWIRNPSNYANNGGDMW